MMHVDIRSMAVGVWAALRLFCACVRSIGSRERHVLVPSFVFSLSWLTLKKLQAKIADHADAVFLLCISFSFLFLSRSVLDGFLCGRFCCSLWPIFDRHLPRERVFQPNLTIESPGAAVAVALALLSLLLKGGHASSGADETAGTAD